MGLMHPMYNHCGSSKLSKSKTNSKQTNRRQTPNWIKKYETKKVSPYQSDTPYIRPEDTDCNIVYRSMEDLEGWKTAKKEKDAIIPEDFCIAPAYNKGAYQVVPRTDTDAYSKRK